MLHLMIENRGVCPPEGFTLFGATTKRRYYVGDARNDLIIGTFGSGNKHATCLLLRAGINPTIFCGSQRLAFFTKPRTIKGVNGSSTSKQVCVRYGGKTEEGRSITREEELSVTLDYGTADWPEIALALREYVSNALDACFEQGMDVAEAVRNITIKVVDEPQVRAGRNGTHTRVFIPLVPEVNRFYDELHSWFLHFQEPALVTQAILPKAGRNRKTDSGECRKTAVIYRRGVYVREWFSSDEASLFDYNLADLRLDESRTAGDWDVKHACGRALAAAGKEHLAQVFKAMLTGEKVWELQFDNYALSPDYCYDAEEKERRKEVWKEAFEAVAGTDGVLMSAGHEELTSMVARKGYNPVPTQAAAWVEAGAAIGIRSDTQVLTEDDKAGRIYSPATPEVIAVLDWVWDVCLACGVTDGKDKPKPGCFWEPLRGESQTWGIHRNGEVLIHTDVAGGVTDMLRWVMLEEVGHYLTGATDLSRDFQTFFIRLASKLALSLTATIPFRSS